jgi:Aspartate/tyrosine/aromatic aminotransferase
MFDPRYQSSRRMESVQSPIIPIVAQLIAQNPGTISLGQGVVYYGPPQTAIDALSQLNDSVDIHKYGIVGGLAALCDTISNKLELENQIIIGNGNRVIVTAGANMAFLNILFAITDPGDEVILSLPYYFNHEMAIAMLNCKPVLVSTDENYQLCTDKIRKAINNGRELLLLYHR